MNDIQTITQPLPMKTGFRRLIGLSFVLALATSLMVSPKTASANSLDSLELLTAGQFKTLVKNVGAATHYKSLAPPEPLGLLGFDVAVELSATDIDKSIFDIASDGGFEIDSFLLPRVHVHKGLPFNLDIGAFYTAIPDTDFQAMGAELRYAILEGTTVTPAVAIRATYSLISGVDQMDLTNSGIELGISKGFAMLTPYGGVGYVRTVGSPNGIASLSEQSVSQNKVYAGININLGLNFALEYDKTGDYATYSAKAGIRF